MTLGPAWGYGEDERGFYVYLRTELMAGRRADKYRTMPGTRAVRAVRRSNGIRLPKMVLDDYAATKQRMEDDDE